MWFHRWMDLEQIAHTLKSWEPLLIPGLLQTEAYARAIISQRPDLSQDEIDEMVAARIARQEILTRAKPPFLSVALDEGILYRPVGDKKVMSDQLLALIEVAKRTRATIQVVPLKAQALLGLKGPFVIASLTGETDYVYVDGAGEGYVTDQESDVEAITGKFEVIRSLALSMPESLKLIAKVVEDKWT